MTITPVQTAINIPYEEVARFCERRHILKMWLFGSVLREGYSPESDIDILVQFDPAHVPGWEFYGEWRDELQAIFGRPVDLSTPDSLRSWVKSRILEDAQLLYVRTE